MVRALERWHSIQKLRSLSLKKMFGTRKRQVHSVILDESNDGGNVDDDMALPDLSLEDQRLSFALSRERGPISRRMESVDGPPAQTLRDRHDAPPPLPLPSPRDRQPSDVEMMKDKFAKLLLGEDMSGGGKGVSSALALSNAITNLAASIFGEQRKLEPMPPERKARWRKEISWLLSVSDYIVEFVPSQQKSKDGTIMEIMVTKQRNDLCMDIPALRKLDAMLIECLDDFGYENEFWYPSKKDDDPDKTPTRHEDKWWIPTVKVPQNGGLSEEARRRIQAQKDSVNQVLKAAMAINAQVLSEMEIPESYIESLPKNGRASLGDLIYKSITVDHFDPEQFLATMDLSNEHSVIDLKNRIEASIVIWKRKMNYKDGKSSWGAMSLEKRELFEERAETILLLIKQQFPGISQSTLDISKIQYNGDVGHAILESYSRIIESLAHTVMSRIDDVLFADSQAQKAEPVPVSPKLEGEDMPDTPNSMTLSDYMGWEVEPEKTDKKENLSTDNKLKREYETPTVRSKVLQSHPTKKFSYLEKLENLSGLRSPTARH